MADIPTIESTIEPLILDLLEWVSSPRTSAEVMDAWRTSCPRLPVWEEANERGLVVRTRLNGEEFVGITASGLVLLKQSGRLHRATA